MPHAEHARWFGSLVLVTGRSVFRLKKRNSAHSVHTIQSHGSSFVASVTVGVEWEVKMNCDCDIFRFFFGRIEVASLGEALPVNPLAVEPNILGPVAVESREQANGPPSRNRRSCAGTSAVALSASKSFSSMAASNVRRRSQSVSESLISSSEPESSPTTGDIGTFEEDALPWRAWIRCSAASARSSLARLLHSTMIIEQASQRIDTHLPAFFLNPTPFDLLSSSRSSFKAFPMELKALEFTRDPAFRFLGACRQ